MEEASEQKAGAHVCRAPGVVVILSLIVAAFVVFIYGVTQKDWEMSQAGAVFFLAGVFAGIVGKLGLNGTAEAFVEGFLAPWRSARCSSDLRGRSTSC